MFEYLEEVMKNKYNYDLSEKVVCRPPEEKNKLTLPLAIVFGVVFLVYILMISGVIPQFYNFFIVLLAFVLLILLPMRFGTKHNKYEALIMTPKYLIQIINKREFVIVDFDEITRYLETQKGEIVISENRKKIVIQKECYVGKLQPLTDILEAKGKTFDKSKDYMIRPIEIKIVDGEIHINEIEVVTKTDKIFEKYYKNYKMLTPGFVKEIIYRNSVVNEVEIDGEELVLKLDKFEVNPGHPENTKFESIIVEDCVTIFESVSIVHVNKIDTHEKKAIITKLEPTFDSFVDEIENGIIAEWNVKGKTFSVKFAAGVQLYEVSFKFNEVLNGWNKV